MHEGEESWRKVARGEEGEEFRWGLCHVKKKVVYIVLCQLENCRLDELKMNIMRMLHVEDASTMKQIT